MISKISEKSENGEESDPSSRNIPQHVYLIAQEIKIVKSLASNDVRLRTKQLKKLKKWLSIRAQSSFPFTDGDFLRIWKGLFYCMWMSDKPLVQEALTDDLGSLLLCLNNSEISAQFFGAFMKTMCLEWFGIDQWRMDKFLMLVRRMLRYMFRVLKDAKWKSKALKSFTRYITETVLSQHEARGLTMHFIDIYLEELAKVSDGSIPVNGVTALVKPFVRFLAEQRDYKLLVYTRRHVFYHLLWQSELGREYQEKFNAWKEMGFPTENINDLEKADDAESIDDDEIDENSEAEEPNSEKPLDPRAGCVDVVIPEIPVDVEPFIADFETLQFDDITNTKSRKVIREVLEKYKTFSQGEFPLGVKRMPVARDVSLKPLIKQKAQRLEQFENQLYSTSRKLKNLSKKKRKRILQSIDVENDAVNEDNFEQLLEQVLPKKKRKIFANSEENASKNFENGWTVEDSSLEMKEVPLDTIELKHKMEKQKMKLKQTDGGLTKKQKKLKALKQKDKAESLVECSVEEKTDIAEQDTTPCILKKTKKKKLMAAPLEDSLQQNGEIEKHINGETIITTSIQKSSKADDKSPVKIKKPNYSNPTVEWNKPLEDGEIEYFVPARKVALKNANESLKESEPVDDNQLNLVLNPFAKNKTVKKVMKNQLLGKSLKKAQSLSNVQAKSNNTPSGSERKRVKIVLKKNSAQKPSEYIKQVLNSPQVPYDAAAKPIKSLLKPNLMPSPINPFYRKKIGLKLLNDTM